MRKYGDDLSLMRDLKAGQKSAYEFLFKSYYPRLRAYALRFIKDEVVVDDMIQECFLHLWEKRTTFTSIYTAPVIFALLRNSCLNYLKHQAIVNNYRQSVTGKTEGEERLFYLDFFNNSEHELLYNELLEQVDGVLSTMSPRTREVFSMSRFEGLKNREIADRLQISTTAVEKHIAKALRLFQQRFKESYQLISAFIAVFYLLG